jgi:hypothetical protein
MILSEYMRNGRSAKVCKNEFGFYVELYEKSSFVRMVELYDKSEYYAENLAENWVEKIGEFA